MVLAHGRPLVSYYANSIAHLLGAFEAGVKARDALPALARASALAKPLLCPETVVWERVQRLDAC